MASGLLNNEAILESVKINIHPLHFLLVLRRLGDLDVKTPGQQTQNKLQEGGL